MVVLLSDFNWKNMYNCTQYFESICRSCGLALRECFPSGIAVIYGVVKKLEAQHFVVPLPNSYYPILPPSPLPHPDTALCSLCSTAAL